MSPPFALPFILVAAIPLLYSLFAAPLFASSQNPDRNTASLTVLVADLDGGPVGAALTAFLANASAASSFVPNVGGSATFTPTYAVVSGADEAELLRRVRDAEAWGAVYATGGASARLSAALASPAGAAAYLASGAPSGAVRFAWDEARNNLVSTGRVAAPTKQLLAKFSAQYASTSGLLPALIASPASAANFAVLANPAFFTEVNLFPFTVPAFNQAAFVGQILLAVFSLVTVNMIWGPLAGHPWVRGAPPGARLAAVRLALCALYAGAVAAAYAAILVGTAAVWNTAGSGAGFFDGSVCECGGPGEKTRAPEVARAPARAPRPSCFPR